MEHLLLQTQIEFHKAQIALHQETLAKLEDLAKSLDSSHASISSKPAVKTTATPTVSIEQPAEIPRKPSVMPSAAAPNQVGRPSVAESKSLPGPLEMKRGVSAPSPTTASGNNTTGTGARGVSALASTLNLNNVLKAGPAPNKPEPKPEDLAELEHMSRPKVAGSVKRRNGARPPLSNVFLPPEVEATPSTTAAASGEPLSTMSTPPDIAHEILPPAPADDALVPPVPLPPTPTESTGRNGSIPEESQPIPPKPRTSSWNPEHNRAISLPPPLPPAGFDAGPAPPLPPVSPIIGSISRFLPSLDLTSALMLTVDSPPPVPPVPMSPAASVQIPPPIPPASQPAVRWYNILTFHSSLSVVTSSFATKPSYTIWVTSLRYLILNPTSSAD